MILNNVHEVPSISTRISIQLFMEIYFENHPLTYTLSLSHNVTIAVKCQVSLKRCDMTELKDDIRVSTWKKNSQPRFFLQMKTQDFSFSHVYNFKLFLRFINNFFKFSVLLTLIITCSNNNIYVLKCKRKVLCCFV